MFGLTVNLSLTTYVGIIEEMPRFTISGGNVFFESLYIVFVQRLVVC